MRYAKLINGQLVLAPRHYIEGSYQISNPTPEMLKEMGFKPVVYTDIPGEAPAGYQWSEIWSENENIILQGWVMEQIPYTEDEALTRYANELTGSSDQTLEEAAETLIEKFNLNKYKEE